MTPHIRGHIECAKNCTFFELFSEKVSKIGVILTFLPNLAGKIGHYRDAQKLHFFSRIWAESAQFLGNKGFLAKLGSKNRTLQDTTFKMSD